MKILYASCLCAEQKLYEIFGRNIGIQIQKFHGLLAQGLAEDRETSVEILSSIPVNREINPRIIWPMATEQEGNLTFKYLPFINLFILRQVSTFINSFIFTCLWLMGHTKERKVLICDVLNISVATGALLAAQIFGCQSLAVVTDVPGYMRHQKDAKKKLNTYERLCFMFMKRYDAYLLLTEQMNSVVNYYNRPYVVIEGFVDVKMGEVANDIEDKYQEKVIIYAGALYEKYGVKKLIHAFMKTPFPDARLWLYGAGEMEEEIKAYEKQDARIQYFGVQSNRTVVTEEIKATLLINPRPSFEEFTKYSFPSKNMEYMASGTPVLTAPLPGMPREYYDYVYILEDENEDGIAQSLCRILAKRKEELHEKGRMAKEYVLKEKNNLVQAGKILLLIRNLKSKN